MLKNFTNVIKVEHAVGNRENVILEQKCEAMADVGGFLTKRK